MSAKHVVAAGSCPNVGKKQSGSPFLLTQHPCDAAGCGGHLGNSILTGFDPRHVFNPQPKFDLAIPNLLVGDQAQHQPSGIQPIGNVSCEQSVSFSPEVMQAIKHVLMEPMATRRHFHGLSSPSSISDASYPPCSDHGHGHRAIS